MLTLLSFLSVIHCKVLLESIYFVNHIFCIFIRIHFFSSMTVCLNSIDHIYLPINHILLKYWLCYNEHFYVQVIWHFYFVCVFYHFFLFWIYFLLLAHIRHITFFFIFDHMWPYLGILLTTWYWSIDQATLINHVMFLWLLFLCVQLFWLVFFFSCSV